MATMIQSTTIAWIGGLLIIVFSASFVRLIQLKIQGWNRHKISPLPLEGFPTIGCWIGTLAGLTIMFTGVLETFDFSQLNSFIASLVLALTTGLPMWGVVRTLLVEVEEGTLKEILPGRFN